MNRTLAIACLCAAAAAAPFGCAKDEGSGGSARGGGSGGSARASRDRHPTPTGRIELDQSAVLPVDVKAGVAREYPGSSVQNVSKRTLDDRVVRYDVTLMTKDGRTVRRMFDEDGKPSEAQAK